MASGVNASSIRNRRAFLALHKTARDHIVLSRFAIPEADFGSLVSEMGSGVMARPEEVGLSSERLARVHEAVQRHIDAKDVSAAVTLIARNGRIAHLEAHGLIDIESKQPMPKDGIFRLASMSKPITAVAVMMMLEEEKLRLSDPVSRFIPELNSKRYLGPRTIDRMSSNHTGDLVNGQFRRPAHGMGFGLGVQIVEDPVAADLRVGAWGWAGAYGTNVRIEPAEHMVQIIMTQTSTPSLQRDFENAVAQAIIK